MKYDVSYKKVEPGGAENWVKIGVAFSEEKSGRVKLSLDAIPIDAF